MLLKLTFILLLSLLRCKETKGQTSPTTTEAKVECSFLNENLEAKNIISSHGCGRNTWLDGESCELKCKTDYVFPNGKTAKSVHCKRNGDWESISTCSRMKCVDSPKIKNKNIVPSSHCTNVEVGGECILKCQENHAVNKNKITQRIKCEAEDNVGSWKQTVKKCTEIQCTRPSSSTFTTRYPCNIGRINSRCSATCKMNYKLPTAAAWTQESTCILSNDKITASWDPPFTDCEAIKCTEKDLQQHNAENLKPKNCPATAIKGTCELTCKENYFLKKSKWPRTDKHSLTCTLDSTNNVGQWSPLPSCQEITCDSNPKVPENVKVPNCAGTAIGGTCTLQCEEQFVLPNTYQTEQTVTCRKGIFYRGLWSKSGIKPCKANKVNIGLCDYWYSYNTTANIDEAQYQCTAALGPGAIVSILKSDSILQQLNFGSASYYRVGAEKDDDQWRWKDGDLVKGVQAASSDNCLVVSTDTYLIKSTSCGLPIPFICEKPTSGNPCSPNPCDRGKCSKYGCSFKCECWSNAFGYLCDKSQVEVIFFHDSYQVLRGRSVSVKFKILAHVTGTVTYSVKIDGQVTKSDVTIISGETHFYDIHKVQNNQKIEVEAKLQRPNKQFVTATEKSNIFANDEATVQVSKETRITAGQALSILCKVTGIPTPNVTWLKDGNLIETRETTGDFTYIRDEAKFSDNGIYKCTAKHKVGMNSTTFQTESEVRVIVEGVPESNKIVATNENHVATLTCTFDGNPLPTVQWKLENGSNIPVSSQFQLGETVKESTYRVTKNLTVYGASCLGIYNMKFTCEGSNTLGSTKSNPKRVEPVKIEKTATYCSNAISTCAKNNGRLLTVRNDKEKEIVKSILEQSTLSNLWINEMSTGNLEKSGNCKILKKWYYAYGRYSFVCEEILVNTEMKVTRYGCKGTELDISFTAKPGASSLQHTAYVGKQKFSLKPKETTFTVSKLSANTTYNVTIIPHFVGCMLDKDYYNSITIKTLSGTIQAPRSFTLKQNGQNCHIKWNSINNHGIGSYQLKLFEQVRSTGKFLLHPTNISLNITTNHEFNMKPNTIYHIHLGVMASYPCQDKINSSWTKQQIGSCESLSSSPKEIVLPTIKPQPGINQMKVTLPATDERNGNISCYFMVVSKSIDDQIANITTNISQLKQTGDEIQDGDSYIAIAIQRFDGRKSFQLGAGGRTCCNMRKPNGNCTADLPTVINNTRIKRATRKSYVVRGEDHKFDPKGKYSVFVLVSTPTEGSKEPMLTASSMSESLSFEEEGGNNGAAIAVPLLLLLILISLIVGVLYVRKWKRKRSIPVEGYPMRTRRSADDSFVTIDDDSPYAGGRNNESPEVTVTRSLSSYAFNLENLAQIMTDKRADEDMLFEEEFKTTIPNAVKACGLTNDIAKLPANQNKNRYRNIVPYDNSRVILSKHRGDEFSDYINASHLDGYNFPGKFIASQGPKPNTIDSFWRMIWEHQVFVIVVLTKLKEKEKIKCAQYWPEQENTEIEYGEVKVTHTETAYFGDYVRRIFKVVSADQQRTLMQFQFIAWPDHGTPDVTSSLLRFHKSVMQAQPDSVGPIAVHCSAGVGRTGTFIALDILSEQIMCEEEINIAALVGRMRTKRSEMVQSLDQYIFIHKLVLEMYHFGDTDVDVSEFSAIFCDLLKMNNEIGTTELQKEFSMLDYFLPLDITQDIALKSINKAYNHNTSVLPYNHNLVFVQMQATDKSVPYYNGSYITPYHVTNMFIAAQTPTTASVSIFWRTVIDNSVSIIIMLSQKKEGFNYWPKFGKEEKYGQVTVRTLEETGNDNDYSERKISVTYNEKRITLTQIHYDKWPEHEPPESQTVILEIIAKVEKHYQTMANTEKKTTLVHCSDGAGRTGAFCAISNLIDRLKNENRIDVFRTLKDLRDLRQNMVDTVNLYECCYRAVSEFLESFDLYGNFR